MPDGQECPSSGSGGSPNLFGESDKSAAGEVVVDRPAFVSFVEAVEDSEEDRSQRDDGDFDDSLWQRERLEVTEDFLATAKLTELLALVEQFHAVVFAVPFVIERTVVSAAMFHPKASAVEDDAV